MAFENILFPPIMDDTINIFQVKKRTFYYDHCKIYFSLSKFNAETDFTSVQAVIYNNATQKSVVALSDDESAYIFEEKHYRKTGIILNLTPHKVSNNLYYVRIYNRDLNSDNTIYHYEPGDNNTLITDYQGQIPGQTYKVQLRLSNIDYSPQSDITEGEQIDQMANQGHFSEWSRITIVKPIGDVYVTIPILKFDSRIAEDPYERKTIYSSTLDISGTFYETSGKENLYSYNIQVYSGSDLKTGTLLEDSGELFSNNFANTNEFKYLCKTEFEDLEYYTIKFKFTTKNQFVFETQSIIMTSLAYVDYSGIGIYTVDDIGSYIPTAENDPQGIYARLRDDLSKTSIQDEQEEGRIGLKLYSNNTNPFYGNFYIRRASSKEDFKYQYDIKLITLKDTAINEVPMFYDYTIESGVQYSYRIQYVDPDGYRGISYNSVEHKVMREFEYSFLLGQNNQQLKLMFNNTMQNYKIQVLDSKSETIGAQYPRVTRNGTVKYKIFPIEGLISTQMDENKLFCTKEEVYNNSEATLKEQAEYEIKDLVNGNGFNRDLSIPQRQYNYTYERDFRDMVMDFLHDGKPKLFKSPTEGNVIVRLMDINCTPIQSLDRLLYSFTSNGNQIAESSVENYKKYKFIEVDDFKDNLFVSKTLLGQICMEIDTNGYISGDDFSVIADDKNIFKIIYNKHNRTNNNYGGYSRRVINIHHVRITFEDQPLNIIDSGSLGKLGVKPSLIGNNICINGTYISVINPLRIYTFDERLEFNQNDILFLLPDYENKVSKVKVIVDYLYDVEDSMYVGKKVASKQLDTYVGQFYDKCSKGDSIYKKIAAKYYIEQKDKFQRLNTLSSVEIIAQPGMAVRIHDQMDYGSEIHVINESGVLNLSRIANITDIIVYGLYDPETRTINPYRAEDEDQTFMVNYHCTILSGTYVVE